MSLVLYEDSSDESETEREQKELPRAEQAQTKVTEVKVTQGVADTSVVQASDTLEANVLKKRYDGEVLLKPPPAKKSHGRVKIIIPTLEDLDDDDDDDDAENKRKTPLQKGVRCGLTSMLPPPKHSAGKEVGRILVPHSLQKPKVTSTSDRQSTKPNNEVDKSIVSDSSDPLTLFNDSDSDDVSDDEKPAGSLMGFFSTPDTGQSPQAVQSISDFEVSKPATSQPSSKLGDNFTTATPVQTDSGAKLATGPAVVRPAASSKLGPTPLQSLDMPDVGPQRPSTTENEDLTEPLYQWQPSEDDGQEYGADDDSAANSSQTLNLSDDFLKIQGRKDRLSKQEINFIDVSGQDQMGSKAELLKNISQETIHVPHSKKDANMPSSLQRRKHQIQYLAFQAKEKEIELKNQWSQNRMTKRQVNSRYGF